MDGLKTDVPDRVAIMQNAVLRVQARNSGGLFRDILKRYLAEEGSRAEATRASRFERLQN
jgi:hypothetical protein